MRTIPGRYPNIERWMAETGTNKSELARLMDVSRCTVRSLFYGEHKRSPHPYTLEAIQRVTGMSYEDAFREVEM